jgi:protein-L-isoaspartate O-methyltransferase
MWITPKRKFLFGLFVAVLGFQSCLLRPRGAPEKYECGFILSRHKAIEKTLQPELEVLQLKPGQVIADVGAANGFHMGMVSVLTDSLTIYLEDIDSLCLNQTELEKVKKWYEWVREEPLTNEFHLVLGTETETRLPEATFDKVIITAALHHFSDPGGMLSDLKTKLRPGGKMYIVENVVDVTGEVRKKTCRHPLRSQSDLEELFQKNGFQVEEVRSLHRSWTKIFVLQPKKEQ